MAGHLHKSFSAQQIRALLERYVRQEIKLRTIISLVTEHLTFINTK